MMDREKLNAAKEIVIEAEAKQKLQFYHPEILEKENVERVNRQGGKSE